jgi:hypothetical protein
MCPANPIIANGETLGHPSAVESLSAVGWEPQMSVMSYPAPKIPDAGNNPCVFCVFYSMRTDDGSATPPSFP